MTTNDVTAQDHMAQLVSDDLSSKYDPLLPKDKEPPPASQQISMNSKDDESKPSNDSYQNSVPKSPDNASTVAQLRRQRCQRITTLIVIGFISLLTGVDYAIILPTAWSYLNSFSQIYDSGIFMGLLLSVFSFSGAIAGLIFGHLNDIGFSLKILILIGLTFKIIGNIIYFIGINFYVVIIARLITGIGMGLVPPILAEISRRSTPETRTALLAKILACRQIGSFLGPCFTIAFEHVHFNFLGVKITLLNAPGFFMAILWIVAFISTIFLFFDLPKPSNEQKSLKERLKDYSMAETCKQISAILRKPTIIVLIITSFMAYFNQTALETTITPFTSIQFGWEQLQVSIVFAVAGVEITLIYVALHFISKKIPDQILLLFAYIILSIALMIGVIVLPISEIGSKKYLPIFLVFIGLDILALPLIAVTTTSLFTKQVSRDLQGMGQGIQRLFISSATVVGPLFAGGLLTATWFMISIMFLLVLFALLLVIITFPSFAPPIDDELAALLPSENKK